MTFPTQLGDGSGANRPWLQETPDPTTTVTWNTWVKLTPKPPKKLGIKDDDWSRSRRAAGEIEALVYRYPAIRPDTIAIPFGQGHDALGRYAANRGANPASLLEGKVNEAGDLAFGDMQVTDHPHRQNPPWPGWKAARASMAKNNGRSNKERPNG